MGSSAFARRYLRNRYYFLFLRLLRCFSSPGSLRIPMYSVYGDRIAPAGFPHSDISGSMPVCGSPKLFAAYHVFHRLSVPRHPPCALISFTYRFSFEFDLLSCCLYRLAYQYRLFSKIFVLIDFSINTGFLMFVLFYIRFSKYDPVLSDRDASASRTHLMEMVRFELMTPCLQGRCSPN